MCNPGRTGLPSTWRVQCVEGQCIDYCPPWDEEGYWFLSDDSPSRIKEVTKALNMQNQTHLSPAHAVMICEMACDGNSSDNATIKSTYDHFINAGLCKCGDSPDMLDTDLALEDFAKAHDLTENCGKNKARKKAYLSKNDTQPICCPYIDYKIEQKDLPKGWNRLFIMGTFNLEGEYFAHVRIECGAFLECEEVARKHKAELAVFDMFNSMCYLARNVFDLEDKFAITKDNQYRYGIDLRDAYS